MLGAIAGDIVGSVWEGRKKDHLKRPDFQPLFAPHCGFTDDTVLTVAVADWVLHGGDLVTYLKDYARAYPGAGYGGQFRRWAMSNDSEPYNSWGNGSAMRVSPIGHAFDLLDEVLERARTSAEVAHNHRKGIKGAQATAAAVFLARTGKSKAEIAAHVEQLCGYDLSCPLDLAARSFRCDSSCRESVPPAIIAFLESTDYEDAVRKAIALGGDSDTIACIAGGIAQAHYGMPKEIRRQALAKLDSTLREVVEEFEARFHCAWGPVPAPRAFTLDASPKLFRITLSSPERFQLTPRSTEDNGLSCRAPVRPTKARPAGGVRHAARRSRGRRPAQRPRKHRLPLDPAGQPPGPTGQRPVPPAPRRAARVGHRPPRQRLARPLPQAGPQR
jgi:ADP-ribosylglycohydrolase